MQLKKLGKILHMVVNQLLNQLVRAVFMIVKCYCDMVFHANVRCIVVLPVLFLFPFHSFILGGLLMALHL